MKQRVEFLKHIAYNLRVDVLKATTAAGSGHPTSCLSAADIAAVLFFYTMHEHDQFILSKGHAAPLLYSVYKELGAISEQELLTLRQCNSVLEGHPTPRFPYVPAATGSLGQGLSVAAGIAIKNPAFVYVLLGDSEMAEGSVWEAMEIAAHYNLKNLVGIIDVNRLGQTTETLDGWHTEKYQKKCEAFGWETRIINGHDIPEIIDAFDCAQKAQKPTMIIAKTIKGYGLPEDIANHNGYHGKAFSQEELPALLKQLEPNPVVPSDPAGIVSRDATGYTPQKNTRKKYITKLLEPVYTLGEQIATRKAYGQAITAAGTVTKEIIVLDAEVKNSTFAELFEAKFPDRFVQCFIAEQNMIGMATGLASQNHIPFTSTFAAFLSRAYDQLRMTAISKLPIRVVGSHAGVSIGQDGPSQMGLEDIGLMRMLPESIVLYPCDAVSTYKCVELMANYFDGISYLRTTRGTTSVIYDNTTSFAIGGHSVLRSSTQDCACVVAAGITIFEALKAYEELKKQNVFIRVIDCYSIKPLPTQALLSAAFETKKHIITVEDHYAQGGLGEAVASALCDSDIQITHLAVTQVPHSGTPEELLRAAGIDAQAIITEVLRYVK